MNWKKILTYVLIVLGFLVLSYGFVPQVLGGKIVNQSDISGYLGMAHETREWNAAHPDDKTAWTESMFGGMPVISFDQPRDGDLTLWFYDLLMNTGKRPATYLFVSLLGAFLLLLAFGVNPLIAAGGAVAVTFCAYNFQIIQVGHNTKMQAIALVPWALAALVYTYRAKKWPGMLLGAALFGFAVNCQVKANHPQITYYLAIIIFLFVLVELIGLLVKKEKLGRFFAATALLFALGMVGLGTNANKLIPTWEYTQYSMRGGKSSGETKGLDIDYATAWSYGWEELPNLMIPNYNGGSSAGEVGPDSETYKLLKSAGQANLREVSKNMPLYWGPQPFTAGPMYIGAITVFLFLLGLFCYKGRERWWLLAATVLAILLAVGNHFLAFTKLAMAALPLYNKFRTVSMALVILQFTMPLLGFLVLDRIVKGDIPEARFKKASLWALGLTAGFCLLVALFPSIAGTFESASDSANPKVLVDALVADRMSLLRTDAITAGILIAASWALLWWGFKKEKARLWSALGVCVLAVVSMFVIGKRYLNEDDFTTPRNFTAQFNQRPVDQVLLSLKDPSYRVLDLTVNTFNDSHPSYWHKSIGGYSPAKLQLYQEYIDGQLMADINALRTSLRSAESMEEAIAGMPYLEGLANLNCKYIIINGEAPPVPYPHARGNAWFEGAPEASITLTSYAPNELRYHYSSPVQAKAVFSEVYYPAGWKLTVADTGEVLPISLSDKVLRSATVPSGEHDLVMRFQPESYATGKTVSLICSILALLAVLAAAALMVFKTKKD